MIEQDTIRLLRECDAGIQMGVASIDDVLDRTSSPTLKHILENCKHNHLSLDDELKTLLTKCHDEGKDPNPVAKGMSWMKTNMMLAMNEDDATIADLMTDGCNMGVKSLHRYLNQYKAASQDAKELTKNLINLEERLAIDIRRFL